MNTKPDELTNRQLIEQVAELINEVAGNMLTKDDAKDFLKKDDAKNFATKEDLKAFATKEDLNQLEIRLTRRIDILDRKFDHLREGLAQAAKPI